MEKVLDGKRARSDIVSVDALKKPKLQVPEVEDWFPHLETKYKATLTNVNADLSPKELLYDDVPDYQERLTFDPTQAKNFHLFQCDPNSRVEDPNHYEPTDFSLTEPELEKFKKTGFLVQPRLGSGSMGKHYYNLYSNDMPVYVTADSVLHAWHWSFDRLFGALEEAFCHDRLTSALLSLHTALTHLTPREDSPIFCKEIMARVDLYLCVALNLSNSKPEFLTSWTRDGKTQQTKNPEYRTVVPAFKQNESEVADLVTAVKACKPHASPNLFWSTIDWNDFKPAGRYEKTATLQSYYRVVKWLSLPIQLAGNTDSENAKYRANFKAALLILHLLRVTNANEGPLAKLRKFIDAMAGKPDATTFHQFHTVIDESGFEGDLVSVKSSDINKLQASFASHSLVCPERINSDPSLLDSGANPDRLVVSMLGASACYDHWALAQIASANAARRTVSIVDVAYSTLNNVEAGRIIADRISNPVAVPLREPEPAFEGYGDHPAVVPEKDRGKFLFEATFQTGWGDNSPKFPVKIHENDTVATIKNILWPNSERVRKNELPLTPITISASRDSEFYCLNQAHDNHPLFKYWPRSMIHNSHTWRFSTYNIFPSTKPDSAPDIVDPHYYTQIRDGKEFHREAFATRQATNSLPNSAWSAGGVYGNWLQALRKLSPNSMKDFWSDLPEAMRTREWALKNLNGQLASWTELQHDFVLYAKRMVLRGGCDYPDGLVELNPPFWNSFRQMVESVLDVVSDIDESRTLDTGSFMSPSVSPIDFLEHFVDTLTNLEDIASRQLRNVPLEFHHTKFLKEMLETLEYGSGTMKFEGWYPRLHWPSPAGCVDMDEGLTCHVFQHMADPATGDQGGLLHGGTRHVDNVVVAVEREEGGVMCYAGGLMQFFEFEAKSRFTDNDWQHMPKNELSRPEWTASFLAL